ncbi:hypothetical protein DYB37_010617 [Aphanomyces astaci]|uniref:DDE-1 domain-containing protein n=1 Tax=Aphanomyces astaci TaxID=112090 RepID=A0A3R7C222_APHAT|nr:hypothetical protein DYB35_003321 [Aphanomyces astaci]RHZ12075.1 hypothetical protein DYB37_010617 [Aphanomyces astaci]RQM30824.1 hypothetical protein B5M09_013176 [Aphanomyces astaci]
MDQLDAINTAMHAFSNLSKARKGWGSHTFSKHEPGWTFWCYLYQWVIQEVASFQGDAGRVTVLTTVIERDMYALDALEIPRSLSLYFMWGVQYCTSRVLGFSCTAGDVYNVDETSFKTKGKSKKVVAIRGSKNVWRGEETNVYHLTTVAAVASDGTPVRPAFILPGVSCATSVLDKCPVPDAMTTASPKAFMNADLFDRWLKCFGEWKF